MTEKHTPGPWSIRSSERTFVPQWEIISPDRKEFICGQIVGDENARLIAAAPDLLDALKATLGAYVTLAESGDAGFWDPEVEAHVKSARAAIAKADGEVMEARKK